MNILPVLELTPSTSPINKNKIKAFPMNQKAVLILVTLLIVFGAINTIRKSYNISRIKAPKYPHP